MNHGYGNVRVRFRFRVYIWVSVRLRFRFRVQVRLRVRVMVRAWFRVWGRLTSVSGPGLVVTVRVSPAPGSWTHPFRVSG